MAPRAAGQVPVEEVRDYRRVNAEIVRLLDAGHTRVQLTGVEGQRLLVSGLRGAWRAEVELLGRAGPELAADLDAPDLIVRASAVADGAARGLRSGALVVSGPAGDGLAYELAGGTVVVAGAAGHRAGLRMTGGRLLLLGPVGRLLADRQSGGDVLAARAWVGPWSRHGATGGECWLLDDRPHPGSPADALLALALSMLPDQARETFRRWPC